MTKLKQKSKFNKKFIIILELTLLALFILAILFINQAQNKQISENTESKVSTISQSIKAGVDEVIFETALVEQQVNTQAKQITQIISYQLGATKLTDITNDDLLKIAKDTGVNSLTLHEKEGEDIKSKRSTEPKNIDLSLSQGYAEQADIFLTLQAINNKEEISKLDHTDIYQDEQTLILWTDELTKEGSYYKQVYYQPKDKPYMLSAKIDTSELVFLEREAGLDVKLNTLIDNDPTLLEVALIDKEFYTQEELGKVNTSKEGVKYGLFRLSDTEDSQALKTIAENPQTISYITVRGDRDVYKVFIPANEDILYLALDYSALKQPAKTVNTQLILLATVILIATGVTAHLLLTKYYNNLQVLNTQIKTIATGDYTYMTTLETKDELQDLSESINSLVKTLNLNFQGIVQHLERQLAQIKNISESPTVKGTHINKHLDEVEDTLYQFEKTEEILKLLQLTKDIRVIIETNNEATNKTESENIKEQLILSMDNLLSKLDKLKLTKKNKV